MNSVEAGRQAIDVLKDLISIKSFSREEDKTAGYLEHFLGKKGVAAERVGNNVMAKNKNFNAFKPTILLNSHHDTVKPNNGYTFNPFTPLEKDGKLFGLGSNDAGGCLVSLLFTFLHYYDHDFLKYNLIFAASAEEEISGRDGIEMVLDHMPAIDFALVGEPTEMNMAIAEKGLMVVDAYAKGKSGHAAREEGDNAIYRAMKDIEWIRSYRFPKVSGFLGPVKMTVTMINAGYQHNIVPDQCHFVIDIRITESYTNEEILDILDANITADLNPRSVRLQPSSIDPDHPVVQRGKQLKMKTYGSPTCSDQALMRFPSLKIGPGKSERSHTADEFIYLKEIEDGIQKYIELLNPILL
ncbi:MAG TPA: M20 family metallo-hydrolase [Cyclobacteriaceae bacterium]